MKKLLFTLPIVALLAAGCNSSKQVSNQTQAPIQNAKTPKPVLNLKIGKISQDINQVKLIQQSADQGHQPWRLDPKSVAIVDSSIYPDGLATRDGSLESIQQVSLNLQTGVAAYIFPFQGKRYEVAVIQPAVGKNKIWMVSDIENSNLSAATTASLTFLSPTKGDVWSIGQSHKILFSQPIPYDAHCVNTVYLIDFKGNQIGALDVEGDNLSLEKGELSVVWDSQTLFSSYCGTSNTSFDVKSGTYRLELHEEDAGHGIGQPIDIYSGYFKLQ